MDEYCASCESTDLDVSYNLDYRWSCADCCNQKVENTTKRTESFLTHFFVSSPKNPEGTGLILGSMNMKYDIYPTLPGFELATCSVPSARQFH